MDDGSVEKSCKCNFCKYSRVNNWQYHQFNVAIECLVLGLTNYFIKHELPRDDGSRRLVKSGVGGKCQEHDHK